MKTIYISGAITGVEGFELAFQSAEERLKKRGWTVVNPAKVGACMPKETTYEGYMDLSLAMIRHVDAIYLLNGYQLSNGAMREYWYAMGAGLTIIKQEDERGEDQ